MTDPSLGRKKKKITITASPQGVEIAEKALTRLGFDSKSNFAASQLLARSTVTKFFQSEPIQLDSLKRICEALKLDWREIAGLTEEERTVQTARNDCISSDNNEGVEQVQTIRRQVTVKDQQTKKIKAELILQGDTVHNCKILWLVLQEHSGDTIEIVDIKEGSIRLIVEGSQEDIERLVSRIKSGELKEVSGFPVEDIQILSESSDYDESTELDDKWRLVQEIVSQAVEGRSLSDADLSDADLSSAHLKNAHLKNALLSGADLSGADLSSANLIGADLSSANLIGAELRFAHLWGANLSDADLSGARLTGARLIGARLIGARLIGARLIGAHLIGAELRGAELRGAELRGANLSSANLSSANLNGANLINAHLIGAELRGANLNGANLNGANLNGANLINANVKNALFGRNLGISEDIKSDLEERGAIFEDSLGEGSPVMTR